MRLCPDCLLNASADQRPQAQNGRCVRCIRSLVRAHAKNRANREARRADETYVALYELQASPLWNGEV